MQWGIQGVSFRSPAIRDQLRPQDYLYSLTAQENETTSTEIITTVKDVIFAPDDYTASPKIIADTPTKIVSMTITEKGYCHDPATGQLDEANPGVVADIENPTAPTTAIGTLAEGLYLRFKGKAAPITLMSCDNLPSNGDVLARILRKFIEISRPEILNWVDDTISFPNCMVDRIVPSTTEEDRSKVEALLGLRDDTPVIAEKFSQWVIEDQFVAGRPSWELADVEMVENVEDYETMKLRLLNGPHSASAYLGYLAGFDTVSDLMAQPIFPTFLKRMMDTEINPGLTVPPGVDIKAYKDSVLDRFSNRALAHRTWQIAMDGSQKLPQRLLGSVHSALKNDLPLDCLALSVAAWMRYVTGVDEQGQAIDVSDPLKEELATVRTQSNGNITDMIDAYLNMSEIFGSDLKNAGRFKEALCRALESLYLIGAADTVKAYGRK